MLKRLYEWMLGKAAHPQAPKWLAGISFAESSFFPIPPDAMLAPMCLAKPERSYWYALICTIASVLGSLLGYAIGYFVFEAVGMPILEFYGVTEKFGVFAHNFNEQGWIVVLLAGFTPLPFKVITIAAGSTAMPLHILVGAAIIARSARFFSGRRPAPLFRAADETMDRQEFYPGHHRRRHIVRRRLCSRPLAAMTSNKSFQRNSFF